MIKRILAAVAILALLIIGMANKPKPAPQANDDAAFKTFTDTFFNQFWKWHPTWAVSVGNHDYDDQLELPTASWLRRRSGKYHQWKVQLSGFKDKSLSTSARMDYNILNDQLDYLIWRTETFQSYKWNPAEYNLGESFDLIMSQPGKSLDKKMSAVARRLLYVTPYYKIAQQNIERPTREHVNLAVQQLNGSLFVFEHTIADSTKMLKSGKLADSIKVLLPASIKAIRDYVAFLEDYGKKTDAAAFRDFRIGKEMFDQKFGYEIDSHYTAEEIYQRAVQRKTEIQNEMKLRTDKLWKKYFGSRKMPEPMAAVKMMIDTLSTHHCARDKFMDCIKEMLPKQIAFIKEKNLLYLDPSKPLVVRETPAYMEGSGAGASINDPGPYNAAGKTFYNVTLLTNYTPEKAESYLREYNDYILQILNIHEAIPGHYTQLMHANQSPSLVKSVFGNGAMIEGWAVYGERMMLEEEYGPATDELWLMYYKWHLRSVINTILDYSIQCLNMSEADAKKLMINEGFQQEAEADGKWKRATLSQVQLCSYFTGFTEIYELREEMKKKQGTKFNLHDFHEKFLSYGSAPVKYIREAMLAEQ